MSIDTYIFDIDHTLYPYSKGVETWFETQIGAFIAQELNLSPSDANQLCKKYHHDFGSTLSGLMYHHDMSPDVFFKAEGAVPLSTIERDDDGLNALKSSDKRKIAFTNASQKHGKRVVEHLGIGDQFSALYGIDDVGYWGKPFRKSFNFVIEKEKIDPRKTVFFEDSPQNLVYPYNLGMKTVLIGNVHFQMGEAPKHIDIHVPDLKSAIEAANAI